MEIRGERAVRLQASKPDETEKDEYPRRKAIFQRGGTDWVENIRYCANNLDTYAASHESSLQLARASRNHMGLLHLQGTCRHMIYPVLGMGAKCAEENDRDLISPSAERVL